MSNWLRSGDKELVEKRYGISYEDFINSILEQHLENKHIEYFKTSQGDYFLPSGYESKGSCYIFHIYRPMWGGARVFTDKIPYIHMFNCKNAIAIYTGDIPVDENDKEDEEYIINLRKDFSKETIELVMWRYYKFKEITEGLYDMAINDALIKTKLLNKYLNDKTPLIQNILEKNKETIQNISEILQDDRLCLVLGAGVSAASNIPLWSEIVSKFMCVLVERAFLTQGIKLSDEQYKYMAKELYHIKDNSPLSKMRYIKNGFSDEEFYSILHELLYQNYNLKSNTDLLYAIANLCEEYGGYSYAKVKKIITYNFDGILEMCLEDLNIKYSVIYNKEQRNLENQLTIYHVHGYLPYKRNEERSEIIFSEEDYHRVYNDPYNWSNIVQVNCFRENVCLFIGCSLTDPNIRRLLDSSMCINNMHYAIMLKNPLPKRVNDISDDIWKNYIMIDKHLTEQFYRSIGVNIIWIDDYFEIPIILKAIDKKLKL